MAEEADSGRKGRSVLWRVYLLIAFVASVVVGSMGYIFYVGNHMAVVHTPLACAAMEIKIEATTAHLWLEEITSGDRQESIDVVRGHMDEADWYTQAMLKGGENPHWKYYPLDDAEVRREVESIRAKLAEFRAIAEERFAEPAESPPGSEIDRKYDVVFAELINGADQVEAKVKQMIECQLTHFRVVQTTLILLCLAVTAFAGIIYSRLMNRQIRYGLELQAANRQLDATNQQLAASEQQLRAANEQLASSEQQLKAANQQLIASNQQLVAGEQQLRAANRQLIASEEESRALARFPSENPNPVLRLSRDCTVIYHNEAGSPILEAWGYKEGQCLCVPEHESKLIEVAFASGIPATFDLEHGDRRFSITLAPIVESGYVNVYGLDITARWRAEERLKKSLEEKEVLLREIHHRVKNNLQIIVSLLSLQSEYIQDERAVELFRESQFRVKSMALLHERLYQTEDLAHINFSDYIRDMTNELLASYGPDAGNIKLKIDVGDVFPSINVAVPCALIINELVSNCLKHAFPGDRTGEIRVAFKCDKQGKYTLAVGDNGVGIAGDAAVPGGRTLGLQLVHTLAEQIEASVVLDKSAGTLFKISFSKPL